jgi:hypothetical protein
MGDTGDSLVVHDTGDSLVVHTGDSLVVHDTGDSLVVHDTGDSLVVHDTGDSLLDAVCTRCWYRMMETSVEKSEPSQQQDFSRWQNILFLVHFVYRDD